MVRQANAAARFTLRVQIVGATLAGSVLIGLLPTSVTAQGTPAKTGSTRSGGSQPGGTPPNTATKQDPKPAASTDDPIVLDEVLMTVDSRVILRSEVEDAYRAEVQKRLNGGMKLDARLRAFLYQQARRGFLRAAVQAQSAMWIQGSTPERIQQIVNQHLELAQKQRIRGYGSVNKMQQDMGLLSKSEFIRERREREKILQALAQRDFRIRFEDRLALMITPKALRAHYKLRLPEMRTTASVDLAIMIFALGADPKASETRASAAAGKWRDSLATGAEVAKEFGGVALSEDEYRNLTAARTAKLKLLPFIRTFVGKAVSETVSKPIRHGDSLYVLKVTNPTPGNEFRWSDPVVQRQLRQELETMEYDRIAVRLHREREKTLKIWPPLDRGRR